MASYRAKPPRGATLNRADPLARRLVGAWLFNERAGLAVYDAAAGNTGNATLTNGPTWVSGAHGAAVAHDGSNDATVTGSPALSGGWTVAVLVRLTADGGFTYFAGEALSFKGLRVNSGRFPTITDGTAVDATSSASIGSEWALVGASLDGTTARVWVGGRQTGSAATAVSGLGAGLVFGARTSAGGGAQACEIGLGLLWNRALTAREHADLAADPFRMFRRRRVPVPLYAAGGGGGGNRRRRVLLCGSR